MFLSVNTCNENKENQISLNKSVKEQNKYTITQLGDTTDLPKNLWLVLNDKSIAINLGCNTLQYGYSLKGTQININPGISTEMMCNEDVMKIEDLASSLMEKGNNIEITNNEVVLKENENIILIAKKSEGIESNAIVGTYTITELKRRQLEKSTLTIIFEEGSNRVNGFAGCNSYFGSYMLNGNQIKFGAIGSSKKYCGSEIGLTENNMLTALSESNRIEITDEGLTFFTDDIIALKAKRQGDINKIAAIDENSAITYEAFSRGTFINIHITTSTLTISEDRSLSEKNNFSLKTTDWDALNNLLKDIDLTKLESLKAPTDKRLYDGAAHAALTVKSNEHTYTTSSFDHGHPPKEIENLVNKVLSIRELYDKQ